MGGGEIGTIEELTGTEGWVMGADGITMGTEGRIVGTINDVELIDIGKGVNGGIYCRDCAPQNGCAAISIRVGDGDGKNIQSSLSLKCSAHFPLRHFFPESLVVQRYPPSLV